MKGTVPRPRWPAPAAHSATRSKPTEQKEPPVDPANRITLSLLEEHAAARARGYDPYNTSASLRTVAAGARKPKSE